MHDCKSETETNKKISIRIRFDSTALIFDSIRFDRGFKSRKSVRFDQNYIQFDSIRPPF